MSNERIGWGILGTGSIAAKFAADLPESRTGRLYAVGSRSEGTAKEFAAAYGATTWYGDYDSVLADERVDAVYIATPHPMHAQWAIRAAEAGKHVLCEKPLTINHADAMAVYEAAYEHDVFCMEAYMYRCHPQTQRLVELIREGAIGDVFQIQASFAFAAGLDLASRAFNHDLAGGGILDVGGYPVSLARLVAGAANGTDFAEPVGVSAVGRIGAESRVDEWSIATLTFAGGIQAQVATGVRVSTANDATIFGSDGYIVLPSPWIPGRDGKPTTLEVHRVGAPTEIIEFGPGPLYAYEADAVAEHLADRQAPQMSWADSLGQLATMDRWRQAIGLTYDSERDDASIPPVSGRAPRFGARASIPHATIPGLDKPVSRLVMGVDNQRTLAHASVMFDDFVERGGNCFDTAYIYMGGFSERVLGRWLANRGVRDDVVVIGKGAHTPHCDPASVNTQLAESLERLGTDRIDVYFLHRDNVDIPVGEFVDVLDEHARAGRIGVFGGSNWTLERVAEANAYADANGRQRFSAVSNNLSLARMVEPPWAGCLSVSDPESRAWLEREGLAVLPWSSQARGFFSGRAAPGDTSDPELVRCWYSDDNFVRLERARSLAADRGVPTIAVALAYVLHQPFPTFPLIGPRSLEETRTSMRALDVSLTDEEVAWLDLR